jgi:integrase
MVPPCSPHEFRAKSVPKSLTDVLIRSLPPGLHLDGKLPSFGIRVGKHRKTWIVIKGKNRTKVTIGHYPSMKLADARQTAHAALGAPHKKTTAPTFPVAREAFLAEPRWRPRSLAVLQSSLRHFTWTRPIDKITAADIAEALDAIPHTSARAHALKDIRTFFNWCVPRYLPSSPCVGFKMPAYRPRERVLTDDELKRVWFAAEDMGVYGKQVQCLITTGQRIGQIVSFEQSWASEDRITFPAEIMKGGREHSIPLRPMTKVILPHLTVTTYQGKRKHELDTSSGVTDWTLHDIRRTFATGLAALSIPIHVTEKLLNHFSGTTGGIVGVYQKHQYWNEQAAALDTWEAHLSKLLASRSG